MQRRHVPARKETMHLRALVRTLALTVSLIATAVLCGGWKWESIF